MNTSDEYKAIVAELAAAQQRLRETDRARAEELRAQLPELSRAARAAADRAALTRAAFTIRWESAERALWGEGWMVLRRRPDVDGHARPEHLDGLDRATENALDTLLSTVRRRLPRRGRS